MSDPNVIPTPDEYRGLEPGDRVAQVEANLRAIAALLPTTLGGDFKPEHRHRVSIDRAKVSLAETIDHVEFLKKLVRITGRGAKMPYMRLRP